MTQLPPLSFIVGGSAQVSATVTNDVANAGVDWVAFCGSAPNCGTFSPAHTASGGLTTYTAPLGVPLKNTIAITALSTTDHSKSATATITVVSAVTGIVITPPLPPSVPAGAAINLGAVVTGDTSNLGVDWTATCTTVVGPVTCSPAALHSPAGGTVPFYVPQTILIPGSTQSQSLVGTTIIVTAFATADHSFTAATTFVVTAPITISITEAPPTSMLTNATAPVIAVVTNDTTNAGVTWTVSCSSFPCGTVTPSNSASGATAIFTAPSVVPSPNPPPGLQVTITAYATATGTSVLSTVTVNIFAPISIQLTQSVPNNTIIINGSAPLTATVSNDPANAGVDWTVSCGSAGACGSFSPAHTASGTPTTFTAPSAIPTGGTLTITATSTTDPTQSAQQVVNVINSPPANSLLQGQFIVLLSTLNSQNGPFNLGGVIVGDGNGNVTGGVFDLADAAGNASAQLTVVTPSTYSLGLNGSGQIQLTLNTFSLNGTFGVNDSNGTSTITLSVVFVTPQHALLSETDTFGSAVGTLDLQNAADLASFQSGAAGFNGTYSLRLAGTEATSPNPRYFVASAITAQASGNSFTMTGYTTDQSDNGAITSIPFTAASQALSGAPNQNGEIRLTNVNVGLPTHFNLDVWLIDANHFVVTDWQDALAGSPAVLINGYLTAQPATPSLSGVYAFTEAGTTATAQAQVAGGILTCGSTGVLDVTPLGGTPVNNAAINASCSAPANGRGLIGISGGTTAGISQFAAYPTLDQGVYLIELDGGSAGTSGPAGAGVALPQTLTAPISASSFSGSYASSYATSTALGSQDLAGQITSDGVSVLSGTADVNSFNSTAAPPVGSPSSGATLGGSFTVGSNGRFPLALTITPATGQPTPEITSINPACYLVDANTCLLLGLDTTAPGTGILQFQNTGL